MTKQSLATGIPATHIGPETGGTGTATAGEGSSAGTNESHAPAAASGLEDAPPAPGAREETEHRSFQPHPGAARRVAPASDAPLDDAGQDLRDITDGKDHPRHRREH